MMRSKRRSTSSPGSRIGVISSSPALFTSTSSLPRLPTTRRTAARSVMSQTSAATGRPVASAIASPVSRMSLVFDTMARSAPDSANAPATAAPMPWLAPVTSTRLPVKSKLILPSYPSASDLLQRFLAGLGAHQLHDLALQLIVAGEIHHLLLVAPAAAALEVRHDVGGDGAGMARHEDDAVGDEDRLFDVVGH